MRYEICFYEVNSLYPTDKLLSIFSQCSDNCYLTSPRRSPILIPVLTLGNRFQFWNSQHQRVVYEASTDFQIGSVVPTDKGQIGNSKKQREGGGSREHALLIVDNTRKRRNPPHRRLSSESDPHPSERRTALFRNLLERTKGCHPPGMVVMPTPSALSCHAQHARHDAHVRAHVDWSHGWLVGWLVGCWLVRQLSTFNGLRRITPR